MQQLWTAGKHPWATVLKAPSTAFNGSTLLKRMRKCLWHLWFFIEYSFVFNVLTYVYVRTAILLWNCWIYVPPGLYQDAMQIGTLPVQYSALPCFWQLWPFLNHPRLFGFPLACSDVAPAEDFQRGRIVPEAAPGAVTTTGQLCQPTPPSPPGSHGTHTTHRHSWRAKTDTTRFNNMRLTQRYPPHSVTCWSVSLCSVQAMKTQWDN